MPRDRHQNGYVEEVGKRRKKWKGHYYVYVRQDDGTEKRVHRAVMLGTKAEMKKWEAERKLQGIIAEKTAGVFVHPSPVHTLEWFWKNRFRPLRESNWKVSSRPKTIHFIENYILGAKVKMEGKKGRQELVLGSIPLGGLDRFTLQMHLNTLAEKYSKSVVTNFRMYIKAMLEEAVEQDFLPKNPARKLTLPEMRSTCKRTLSAEEITELLGALDGRDRLIVRMFLVLGLRPGEMFALRRNDRVSPAQLRIDESASEALRGGNKIVRTKTEASTAHVWLPKSIETELDLWMEMQQDKRAEAFLFASAAGTPLNLNNYLNRVIKPAAERARKKMAESGRQVPDGFLQGINHQAFRRTCATLMQGVGTVKDVQAHLRHTTPAMTIGVYMQSIPESVRKAVDLLDSMLKVHVPDKTSLVN